MSPFRRLLLVLLDPRPPLWADATLWGFLGIGICIIARFVDPKQPYGLIADWVIGLGLFVVALAILTSALRRSQLNWHRKQLIKRGAGLCPNCAYSLKDLTVDRCPECGTDIEAATQETARTLGKDI